MSYLPQIKDFLKFFVRLARCRLRQVAFSNLMLEHIFKAKNDGIVYTRCFEWCYPAFCIEENFCHVV